MAKVTSNVRVRTAAEKAAFTARMAAARAKKAGKAAPVPAKGEVSAKAKASTKSASEPTRRSAKPQVDPAPTKKAAAVLGKGGGPSKERSVPNTVEVKQLVSETNKTVVHTMARSYLRSGKPGAGKLRGENYQCTVGFTASQMAKVRAAATFRGVSLAEMIRSCVVEHLDPT